MFRKFAILITVKSGFYVVTPTTIKEPKIPGVKYIIIFDTYQFTIEDLHSITKHIVGGYMATDNMGILSHYLCNIVSHYVKIIKTKRKDAYDVSFSINGSIYHSNVTNLDVDVSNTISRLELDTSTFKSCCITM